MSRAHRRTLTLAAALLVIPILSLAAAQEPPRLTKPVNDFANVIDAQSAQEIERRIVALKNATGDVVIVATVPTFQPYGDIKEYAVKMFENAGKGIGERSNDNGLLIVVAVEDRKIAIEVGYGLEPFITDGFSGQTIREAIAPPFRQGRYGEGLLAGATRVINRIAEQRQVTLPEVPRAQDSPAEREPVRRRGDDSPFPAIGFVIFLVLALLMGRLGRRRRRRFWGGGPWSGWDSGIGPFGGGFGGFGGGFGGFGGGGRSSGGGGFGGFGGGRSGGGGATGGW